MKGITTILFDIDGTILDTRDFILNATEHALSSLGKPIPDRAVMAKHVGKAFEEYYASLVGPGDHVKDLMKLHHDFQLSNLDLAKLFEGTLETLKVLHEKGYKIAAVTSRSKQTSSQTLADCGILDFFDTVISKEDTKDLKPNPAPLFLALGRLGEQPENAVMIGDSHFDIEAGKNAGIKTIRATYGFHADNLHDPEPDFFINDITELLKIL
ncbi:MAG: HAD-IA family hydrolase [Patescibacteria group bacterium]